MPESDQPPIQVEGLVVSYGATVAVDGLDLRAEKGEVVALLGRNGAGKTSTVETLEGYRKSASGAVRVLGVDPGHPEGHRYLSSRIGVMLQRGGVYPGMGPREALHLFSRYYRRPVDPDELLDRLGLAGVAKTAWRRLSGGEQQRLSLGLALIGRPEVVFLDEPTAGVDPQGRLAIRSEIARLRTDGACVILTTHELDEAERVADHIVIVDHGKVVAEGTPDQLTATGGGSAQTRFGALPGLDTTALSLALGAAVSEPVRGEYVIDTAGTPQVVAALTAWLAANDITLKDLRSGRQKLEDVFIRLTGGSDQ